MMPNFSVRRALMLLYLACFATLPKVFVDAFHTSRITTQLLHSSSSSSTRLQSQLDSGGADQYHHHERRAFVASTMATLSSAFLLPKFLPASAADSQVDYKAVAKDVMDLVDKNPDWGPTMVRLAWHASGTYDKNDGTGGSNGGTIRFKEELAHGGNAGLSETAVKWLDPIYSKYDGISFGDLYTLAGVASIKAMGGPTIGWSSGRTDAPKDLVTPDGRLPNADSGPPLADPSDAEHLRNVFYRQGFNDQEIVILSGAHALGRCHTTASGYDGPWTPTPTTFNNAYYSILTSLKWVPKDWSGPPQYVDGATGRLMMLPTDYVLLEDKSFKKWVDVYAKDGKKFDKDFAKAFQKLEENGCKNLKATEWV